MSSIPSNPASFFFSPSRYFMKLGMDELIEDLQINLEKDFRLEDDAAMEKLREVINELASNRMDLPGRPPPEELPSRPFGMVQHLTLEQEVGYRTGFTEKEREFSEHTIQRQIDTEQRLRSEPSFDEGEEEGTTHACMHACWAFENISHF